MYKHGGDIYNNVDCLDFSANINFLGMPSQVTSAVKNSVEACVHYPDVQMTALKNALAEREKSDAENIICGNGAAELIFAVTAAIKPKKALIFAPSFHEYEQALTFNGAELVLHELKEENNFSLSEKEENEVLGKIDETTDLFFVCNPNNPTGIITNRDVLERMLKKCEEMDTILVVDECFLDFVPEKEKYSVTDLVAQSKNLFVLKAFTKIFAMPGLRFGYGLCSNEKLLQKMKSGMQPWNVSVPAQAAAKAAAGLGDFEEKTRRAVETEKNYLLENLKLSGVKIYGFSANYIFFKAAEDFGEKMREHNILVRDCSNYRGLGAGYYRIAVRSHEENMMFVETMKNIL